MKKLLFSLLTLISLTAFAQESKTFNDPNAVSRKLNAGFTAISVSSGIDLYLTQGNEESIAVSANDPKFMERFKTEAVNGTLKIYYDHNGVNVRSYEKRRLKAYVSCKTLNKLSASAGSDVTVNGAINAGSFILDVSSGADFEGDIKVTDLTADVSSGASVKLSGQAGKMKVEASSGADVKGYDFTVDYCDAKASSGASVYVTINKELSAVASSGADIRYKGTALIRDLRTSGGGGVKKASK